MSYVNSLSQTLFLQNQIKSQQGQLTTLQQIVANGGRSATDFSGFTPDVGRLGIRLRGELSRNDAYKNTISTETLRTTTIETALTSVDSNVNYLANTITQLNAQDPSGAAVRQTAAGALNQIVSQLNAQANGVSVFAGIAVNSSGVASYPISSDTAIKNLLTPAALTAAAAVAGVTYPFTGATATADAQATIKQIFSTTSGWFVPGAAGVPAAPTQIADDRTLQTSVSANPSSPVNNPYGAAIRDTLAAVASVAVLQPSDFGSTAEYDNFLVGQIGTLNTASTEINHAVAVNGVVRHQLGDQLTINDTSSNLLQQGLDGAEVQDLSTSITNLNNLQTQLQASYQVTAQLRGLSLVNFLPG
jgi:flagellar hook-associated protein 3 FlgL